MDIRRRGEISTARGTRSKPPRHAGAGGCNPIDDLRPTSRRLSELCVTLAYHNILDLDCPRRQKRQPIVAKAMTQGQLDYIVMLPRILRLLKQGKQRVAIAVKCDGEIRRAVGAASGSPSFAVLSPGAPRATPSRDQAATLGFKIGAYPTGILSPGTAGIKSSLPRRPGWAAQPRGSRQGRGGVGAGQTGVAHGHVAWVNPGLGVRESASGLPVGRRCVPAGFRYCSSAETQRGWT